VGGSDKMALGDDCTFNRYDGPIVSDWPALQRYLA